MHDRQMAKNCKIYLCTSNIVIRVWRGMHGESPWDTLHERKYRQTNTITMYPGFTICIWSVTENMTAKLFIGLTGQTDRQTNEGISIIYQWNLTAKGHWSQMCIRYTRVLIEIWIINMKGNILESSGQFIISCSIATNQF